MGCRLIINADDFGWSEGANEAICALYDEGIVTSASLMVGAPAARDAAARAQERPGLAVGLHMVLVHGPALLPRPQVSHLVDSRGWFSMDCSTAGLRYTLLPACRRELREELEAQFEAFAGLGLPWSHVDSHLHFGLAPVFFHAAVELARGYEVRGFRVPEDDYDLYRRMDPRDADAQRAIAAWFRALCRRQRPVVEAAGFTTTRFCYGLFRTGRLTSDYLVRLVQEMPEGDLELHCHPDRSTEAGCGEFEALRSPEFRRALEERGVEPATYASLGRKAVLGRVSQDSRH